MLICSSTDTHSKYIIEAAHAGKHIFCEKPIDYDLTKVHAAINAAKEAGVKLQIGFCRRFDHNHRAVYDMVRGGKVGKVNIITNAVLYGICLFLFDVSTVIYSLIYAAVSAFAVDHEHSQNINVEVRIITKLDDMGLEQEILQKMDRGITRLESTGAYTNEKSNMLYILVSKYEVGQLKNIVLKYDPHAFIVMNEGVTVIGHYKKKL